MTPDGSLVPADAVPAKIALREVSKSFPGAKGPVLALDRVSLSVEEGEFVVLVGPSGCGKTTLLHLVAGLDFPDAGEVSADGRPVAGPGSDRVVMFQEAALFPWLDAMENVLFGLHLKTGLGRAKRRGYAHYYLRMVGLGEFRHAVLHELSGGMKQRVALARALAPEPRVLLMDEPFAALDAMAREQFYADLQQIWQQHRRTILLVTHNMREAVCLGDRVVLLSPHPGRVRQEFRVDLPRPRDLNAPEISRTAASIKAALAATP